MAFCTHCGAPLRDGDRFCSNCGAEALAPAQPALPQALQYQQPAPEPSEHPPVRRGMGVLCYFGFLLLIPFLSAKDDPFVKFHLNQGLLLLAANLAVYTIGRLLARTSLYSTLNPLLDLLNLAVGIFSVIGIVHAARGRMKPLPLIGDLYNFFK